MPIALARCCHYNPGMTKFRVLAPVLGSLLLIGSVAVGQPPVKNINKGAHPNLAQAQTLSQNAYKAVTRAQEANEFDLGGHAAKAKALLEQVNNELKLAAQQSNKNK
jgi:hypothetical protein